MSDKNKPNDAKQQKADRLSQALRENLRKRKAQARGRNASEQQADKSADETPSPNTASTKNNA